MKKRLVFDQALFLWWWGAPGGAGSRIEDRDRGAPPSNVILSEAKDLGTRSK